MINMYKCLLCVGHLARHVFSSARQVLLPPWSPGLKLGQSRAEILAPSFPSCHVLGRASVFSAVRWVQ